MDAERCARAPCPELQQLERRLDRLQAGFEQDGRRLGALERDAAVRQVQYESILEKLDQLLAWQDEQRRRPARRWEAVAEKALLAAVTAVVAYVLGRLGL